MTEAYLRRRPSFLVGALRDTIAVARRNLIGLYRVPQLLVFILVQPVIFVVLFRYVFGGAIAIAQITPYPYVDYLMPGVFVQTVVFGSIGTAIGISTDIQSGMLERFRALPMKRSAFLAGLTLADLVRQIIVIVLITGVGFAVGFRIHSNPLTFMCGMLLVLLFAYVLSWLFALEGLLLRDPESAQAAAFPVMAPLVFASSAFIPVSTMPSWLQGFAKYQPVSVTASAMRSLALGGPTANYVLQSLAWCFAILALCAPLAVWYYRRSV